MSEGIQNETVKAISRNEWDMAFTVDMMRKGDDYSPSSTVSRLIL